MSRQEQACQSDMTGFLAVNARMGVSMTLRDDLRRPAFGGKETLTAVEMWRLLCTGNFRPTKTSTRAGSTTLLCAGGGGGYSGEKKKEQNRAMCVVWKGR